MLLFLDKIVNSHINFTISLSKNHFSEIMNFPSVESLEEPFDLENGRELLRHKVAILQAYMQRSKDENEDHDFYQQRTGFLYDAFCTLIH